MQCVAKCVRAAAVAAVSVSAISAQAQTWTPLAFGPLGGLPGGQYFTSVADISRDGRTFVGTTNLFQQIWRTPAQDYTMTGGSIFSISPSGLSAVGGNQANQPPRRWDIANAVGSSIAHTDIGSINYGPAYAANSAMTAFALPTPTSILTGGVRTTAQSVFQAANIGASAGAYRGLASDAPIMNVLGFIPGNPTNAYRWNYQTNNLQPLALPAGASSISLSTLPGSITGDGGRSVGYYSASSPILPGWWDESGAAHPVTLLSGSVAGNLLTINYNGTLAGGLMGFTGGVGNRAILTDLATGEVINLDTAYRNAGYLPTGWILRATHHISEDGSRIFCVAEAPDGTSRVVLLEGSYLPTPGALAVFASGLLSMSRRRR